MKKKLDRVEISDHIVSWLKNYCESFQLNGFIVGVSGGIDSALTSTLCAKTGLRTQVISMPIRQHQKQYQLAKNHLSWLEKTFPNVASQEIDLTEVFTLFEKTIKGSPLALANSRARLRMTTLYAIASKHCLLVAGTGNKIEDFGIGFFTKYGDGGVDVSPIADLTKTEVRSMAKYLGVHQDILAAPPTDGLWEDNRTDEDQIGLSYEELEHAMHAQEGGTWNPKIATEKEKVAMGKYLDLRKKNQHKMKMPPVCKISRE